MGCQKYMGLKTSLVIRQKQFKLSIIMLFIIQTCMSIALIFVTFSGKFSSFFLWVWFCFIQSFVFFFLLGGGLFGLLHLRGFGCSLFFNGSLFASPINSKYPLSSLLWPFHFRWPLETCQKCSPSC